MLPDWKMQKMNESISTKISQLVQISENYLAKVKPSKYPSPTIRNVGMLCKYSLNSYRNQVDLNLLCHIVANGVLPSNSLSIHSKCLMEKMQVRKLNFKKSISLF